MNFTKRGGDYMDVRKKAMGLLGEAMKLREKLGENKKVSQTDYQQVSKMMEDLQGVYSEMGENPVDFMELKVTRVDKTLPVPKYFTEGSAGIDLAVATDITLQPGETTTVPTGAKFSFSPNNHGLVIGRSSTSKSGVLVHSGLIDSDYTGEVHIIITNLSNKVIGIRKGHRIAQLILFSQMQKNIVEVENFKDNETRGNKGFGSTGE